MASEGKIKPIFKVRQTLSIFLTNYRRLLFCLSIEMDKNYITPSGLKRLQDELRELIKVERPALVKTVQWAASNGDRSENADYIYGKKRLREIDRRSRFLTKRIESAEIVDPKSLSSSKVVFGATVALEDEDGKKIQYTIVGEDEFDIQKGKISWKSPLAKAMMGKSVGDEVTLKKPKGISYYEVMSIKFQEVN